jgi:hypothetical protein
MTNGMWLSFFSISDILVFVMLLRLWPFNNERRDGLIMTSLVSLDAFLSIETFWDKRSALLRRMTRFSLFKD